MANSLKYVRQRALLSIGGYAFVFLLILTGIVAFHPWYPEAKLVLQGKSSSVPAELSLRWNSGHGFNGYERERFDLQYLSRFQSQEKEGVRLRVHRLDAFNSASLDGKVVLRNIIVDGQKIFPPVQEMPEGIHSQDGVLIFNRPGAELALTVHPKFHLQFEFPKANRMGRVEVQVGAQRQEYDLYASNEERQWSGRHAKLIDYWFASEEGEFQLIVPLPRYPVQQVWLESETDFVVSSVFASMAGGQIFTLGKGEPALRGVAFSLSGMDRQLRQYFHPHRFVLQIIFALIITCLLGFLINKIRQCGGMRNFFLGNHRFIFWSMLFPACLLFFFWQVAFWPAIMSNDSLEVWRAAQIPGMYLGDHPPLNVIWYFFLSQIWNNPAVVPLAQNFLTALLIAYSLFSFYRRGLPLRFLWLCYGVIVFSLPVGLYTAILWKDVPFALLVVLTGVKMCLYLYDRQDREKRISTGEWVVLLLLTLALAGFRHNGVIYLLVVPLLLVVFRIIRIRFTLIIVLFTLSLLLGTLFFYLPSVTGNRGFLANQTSIYVHQALNRFSIPYMEETAIKYLGVFDVRQKNMQWDLVHLCVYGRYQNDFLRNVRWNDVYSFCPLPENQWQRRVTEFAWKFYWTSFRPPFVYLSWNPVFFLVILPFLPLFYRRFPLTAMFSLYILIPMTVLVWLHIFNWRYYYFAYLSLWFLLPIFITDWFHMRVTNEMGCGSSTPCSCGGN